MYECTGVERQCRQGINRLKEWAREWAEEKLLAKKRPKIELGEENLLAKKRPMIEPAQVAEDMRQWKH